MTWHLKDRELEEKLLAIDPKFVSRLDRATKDALEFEGKGFLVAGVEAVEVWYKHEVLFALDFSITELEEVEDYNPNDWNAFPEITPPVDVVMRVEFRASSEGTKAYWDGTDWRRCRNKGFSWDPVIEKDIDRYRPWGN